MPILMTCEEYCENLWSDGTLAPILSDQYHSGGVDTERLFSFLQECAKAEGVVLSDVSVWDYDKSLYACYEEDCDKGLS